MVWGIVFLREPVLPKIIYSCVKNVILEQVIIKVPESLTAWLFVEIEGKVDKVVVGECERNNVCFCDRSGESGRDIEAVNTCVNICVIVRIFAGPCKFSYVAVSVTPYVSQVILLCNSM